MKIIHLVLGKANPDRMNGVNKLVFEMLTTQHSLGYDVELWGITGDPTHNYPERVFKTVLFRSTPNKLSIDTGLKQAILALEKDTVFHMHGSFIPEYYHVSRLLVKQKINYVYTPHGALAEAAMRNNGYWKKKVYLRLFEGKLIRDAACLIATGVSVYDNSVKLAQPRKRALIPNGQPILEKRRVDRNMNKLVFGFCGRIKMDHKGLDLLLKGFQQYRKKGGKGEIQFIGDGAEMPVFKALAKKLRVYDYIKLYGAQFGEEKFKFLSKFDVFVHTSRNEGFPAAVLEAASMGIPVMISRATNVWDFIEKYQAGLLVEPNTPEEIGKVMLEFERLFNDGTLMEVGVRGQQMISELFDWKVICKNLYKEYHAACSTPLVESASI